MVDSSEKESESENAEAAELSHRSDQTLLDQNRGVVNAASILVLANIVQRVLGMAREIVVANLFGATPALAAFNLAKLVPDTLYQLIAGGEMMNSSLVPVFSDYVGRARREELWTVFGTVLSLVTVVLTLVVILVELLTPQVAWLVGAHNLQDPSLLPLTIQLIRFTTPVMLLLSVSSVIMAVLYALQRFTLPAFTTAVFNVGIILFALLRPGNVFALAWGMMLGATMMILLQLPALRDMSLRLSLDWRHPVVRQILRLYAPIAFGLIVTQASIIIGNNLATRTGDQSVNYMRYSTTLYQLPVGLIVVAISTAILPTLSQQAGETLDRFKGTLSQGLRLVILLILPATVGLFVLAVPIIQLLFEHGEFLAVDTFITSQVLRIDLVGLPFAGIDLMLIYAFYARKDTFRPAMVGVLSVLFYLVMAVLLIDDYGLLGLMAANAGKLMLHAAIMLWLLWRQLDGLTGFGIRSILLKSLIASFIMGAAAWGIYFLMDQAFLSTGLLNRLLFVLIPGGIGTILYAFLAHLFKIEEMQTLISLLKSQNIVKKWK